MAESEPQTARLCVVCPCFNEELGIRRFYSSLKRVLSQLVGIEHRIHFVDDGSTDGTLAVLNVIAAEDEHVSVFSLSRNFGHQVALTAGLDTAEGDAVIMMDSDLQHPPEVIPELVQAWKEGSDVISAVRINTEGSSCFKRWSSRMFYHLINRYGDISIMPNAADFCLLSRSAHEALRAMPERHRFLRGMISWIGFRRSQVRFAAPPRAVGESKYTLSKMIGLALDATISFSTAPIRLASRVGAAVVVLGCCYFIYILSRHLVIGDLVLGWGSLICTVLVLGGTQLFFTGLIGEYLARVFEESKRRPLYFFKQQPGQERIAARRTEDKVSEMCGIS